MFDIKEHIIIHWIGFEKNYYLSLTFALITPEKREGLIAKSSLT